MSMSGVMSSTVTRRCPLDVLAIDIAKGSAYMKRGACRYCVPSVDRRDDGRHPLFVR
jgi:hypothetical protein